MKFYLFGMLRTFFLTLLALLAVFFVSVPNIRADIVTFQFDGELTDIDTPLEEGFSVGDTFTGTYTFNSDAPVPELGVQTGFFLFKNIISAMSFSTDDYIASASNGDIFQDFSDIERFAHVDFDQVSGGFYRGLIPNKLSLFWSYPTFGRYYHSIHPNGVSIRPGFNPYSPPDPYSDYFDANGNIIYSWSADLGLYPNQPLFYSDGTPASRNGRFFFSFLDDGDQESYLRGQLNSITVISNIPSLLVPDNKWIQIGLNTAPPTGSTVADIIGDDISTPYGIDWVIYSYQTSTNTYKKLSLADEMLPGIGYWLIQVTGNPITIDMPDVSTDVNVTGHPACTSISEGCFEVPLQTTNSIDVQWQMIGYPFRYSRDIDKVRIVTNGVGSDCFIGCTLKEASEKGLVSEAMWHFDGTSYQQLIDGGSESFDPWDGAWIATLPAASGQAPKLLIPAAN